MCPEGAHLKVRAVIELFSTGKTDIKIILIEIKAIYGDILKLMITHIHVRCRKLQWNLEGNTKEVCFQGIAPPE